MSHSSAEMSDLPVEMSLSHKKKPKKDKKSQKRQKVKKETTTVKFVDKWYAQHTLT